MCKRRRWTNHSIFPSNDLESSSHEQVIYTTMSWIHPQEEKTFSWIIWPAEAKMWFLKMWFIVFVFKFSMVFLVWLERSRHELLIILNTNFKLGLHVRAESWELHDYPIKSVDLKFSLPTQTSIINLARAGLSDVIQHWESLRGKSIEISLMSCNKVR